MPYWKIKYNPSIDMNCPTLQRLIGISQAYTQFINQLPLPPGLQIELDELYIKRETLGTTAIEGNAIAENEIDGDNKLDHIINYDTTDEEMNELINSRRVVSFLYGENALAQYGEKITEELICKLHAIITAGSAKNGNKPGCYRTHSIFVGKHYEGEKFEQVPAQMKKFVAYINSEEAMSYGPIIRAIIAHFYLVTIHPFSDGNGRTSRALEAYILAQAHVNKRGFYSLANYYYKNRALYFKKLDDARFKYGGDLNDFVLFAFKGYVSQQEETLSEIVDFIRRIAFSNYLDELVEKRLVNARSHALISYIQRGHDDCISDSLLYGDSDAVINAIYGKVSKRTRQRDIAALEKQKIIVREASGIRVNLDVMNEFVRNKMLLTIDEK